MNRDNRNHWRMTVIFVALLAGAWSPVFAFTQGACQQDADKLCPGLTGKELTPCLKQHETELSTACKVNLAEARQMVREAKDACEPDIKKFCADVQVGGGRIRRCLKAHESELTSACKAKVAEAKKKIMPADATPAPASATPQSK
jgi:hypothetical protein